MSIRLAIQAEDAEVESLLTYLQAQPNTPIEDKIFLLERTLKWLRASTEGMYDLGSGSNAIFQFGVGDEALFAFEPTRMPSQRL
jgi:hypothetical protein